MNAIFIILTVLVIIASILITLVVLLQNGKGGGLASNFAAGNQTFGVRQTADILEKITWGLVVFILIASVGASFTTNTKGSSVDITDKIENVEETQMNFPSSPVDIQNPSAETDSAAE